MSVIRFDCDGCRQKMKASVAIAGRSTQCPRCRKSVRIPLLEDGQAPARSATGDASLIPPSPVAVNGGPSPTSVSDWSEARVQLVDLESVQQEWQAIHWSSLNPFAQLFVDRPWSLVWVQLLTLAFCFPLVVAHGYDLDTPLEEAAWALSLYFALLWAVFLHRCLLPERIPKRTLLGVWCATAFLGVLAVLVISAIGMHLPGAEFLLAAMTSTNVVPRLCGWTLSVGLIEEGVKAIPVLWAAQRPAPGGRLTTTMYLGALSGLAFGATEGLIYSIGYAEAHENLQIGYGTYLVAQVLRFVSLPLLHAIWSGILGYFIGVAPTRRPGSRAVLITGLLLVSLLHGAYDAFMDHEASLVIALVSLGLFVCYVRRAQRS